MTIFTLSPDRIKGVQGKFRLRATSILSVQPYVGTRSPFGPTTQLWSTEISSAQMERADWQWLSAFFSRAAGISGLVRMGDPWRRLPLHDYEISQATGLFSDGTQFSDGTGWAEGYLPPFVVGAEAEDAGATSLVLKGFPASLVPALYVGDLFEIRPAGIPAAHGHLYEVMNNAPTDADGWTRVNFKPELYTGIAIGDQVVIRDPTSVFRLTTDDEGAVERMLASIGQTGFSMIEERP